MSSLFIPPTTTPASTTIVSRSAKSGSRAGSGRSASPRTAAARRPEIEHRDADHPVRPARRAGARCGSPSRRRACAGRRSCVRAGATRSSEADRRDDDRDDRDLADVAPTPIVTGRFRYPSDDAAFPSGPNASRAMLWSRKATAKVATSITAGDCVAQRPEDDPLHRERERDHDGEAERRSATQSGQSHCDANASA